MGALGNKCLSPLHQMDQYETLYHRLVQRAEENWGVDQVGTASFERTTSGWRVNWSGSIITV